LVGFVKVHEMAAFMSSFLIPLFIQKETNNVRHHPTLRPSRPVLATLPGKRHQGGLLAGNNRRRGRLSEIEFRG
ncbi:hypothetical protein, partial [Rhizobium leguminosarum]|uniref:hypothetical protein n=1 Tax=Rhizobium leguminosarum TaxID=384 RepID=UPI001A8D624A